MSWPWSRFVSAWFALTLFVSAALLFLVQPMIAKMVLPTLGGTPAVWNTCMVFFQSALLAGYAYAHALPHWLGVRRQALLHLGLLLCPFAVLPLGLAAGWERPAETHPILWLLGLLLLSVGLPFFVLSTSGPLLQKWFAHTGHPGAADPYYLYAASNLGSLLALFAYPILVEPFLPLTGGEPWTLPFHWPGGSEPVQLPGGQAGLWTVGYGVLLLLTAGCALCLWRSGSKLAGAVGFSDASQKRWGAERFREASLNPTAPAGRGMTAARRMRWIALAFVPSSLMLSATTYLTTDIASIPLLWVLPLGLYLLTFTLTFARRQLVSPKLIANLLPLVILLLVLALLSEATEPIWLLLPLHLAGLFVLAMACHGELARDRPPPEYLTEFYLWLSLGGALGGLFNGLVAPLLFNGIAEYPLALGLACLLWATGEARGRAEFTLDRQDVIRPLVLGLVIALVIVVWQAVSEALGVRLVKILLAVAFGIPAVVCYTYLQRPLRFALGIIAVLLAGQLYHGVYGPPLYRVRSFFGVHRITRDPESDCLQLVHGNTLHARMGLSGELRGKPLAYYTVRGPIGSIFTRFSGLAAKKNVGIIGLGAGSLAYYAQKGQHFTFYEIDPAVVRIARDGRFFPWLRDCPANVDIKVGDARLTLAEAPDHHYGMLVVDAFSSDAIPLHLLTREAVQLYFAKLTDDGFVVFNISNRYLELRPVLAALARDAGLVCHGRDDLQGPSGEYDPTWTPSQWVVLLRRKQDFGRLAQSGMWPRVTEEADAVWTDQFSNVFGVFRWHRRE
jgi:hypothetical protein